MPGTLDAFITLVGMLFSLLAVSEAFATSRCLLLHSSICSLMASRELDFGPFEDGQVQVSRGGDTNSLYYRVYDPGAEHPPLVVVHGGPSLPSQYLYPIVPLLGRQRPVIFYDQLGCGKSDEPKDVSCYSVSQSVRDLEAVISALVSTRSFHLLGHSYGGNLAYEFVSCRATSHPSTTAQKCQSLILSNAAQNMRLASSEYDRLWKKNPLAFWNQHACRVGIPPALEDALQNVGKVWGGMHVVLDYVAQPVGGPNDWPPTLLITGSNDFGYVASNEEAWKPVIPNLSSVNLEDCAHYPFYENDCAYGSAIDEFLDANE